MVPHLRSKWLEHTPEHFSSAAELFASARSALRRVLTKRLREHLISLYYSYYFDRKLPYSSELSQIISTWERELERGDIPVAENVWDLDYSSGRWGYLGDLEEIPRYSLIAGFFQFFKPGGSLLDVGCGVGSLQQMVCHYSRYVGVDVSKVAIDQCLARKNERCSFIKADAFNYVPNEYFDAIVFNEVLYYFSQPVEVLRRYERWLNTDGIWIISLYGKSERAKAIHSVLPQIYTLINEVTVCDDSQSWVVSVLKKRECRQRAAKSGKLPFPSR